MSLVESEMRSGLKRLFAGMLETLAVWSWVVPGEGKKGGCLTLFIQGWYWNPKPFSPLGPEVLSHLFLLESLDDKINSVVTLHYHLTRYRVHFVDQPKLCWTNEIKIAFFHTKSKCKQISGLKWGISKSVIFRLYFHPSKFDNFNNEKKSD